MIETPLIVICSDGTVLAATGDLPPGLEDAPLDDCAVLSGEVREAGRMLLRDLHNGRTRVASRTAVLDGTGRQVLLIAVEALTLRRGPTDLRKLLTSKLAILVSQATTAGLTLTIEHAREVPATVPVDAEKVAWAITTLVGNSMRYAQTGSRDLRGKSIAVTTTCNRDPSEVVVEVRDDGPGVSEDTVRRLFKRDGLDVRGAGLALLLISDIMAAHAGRIDVQSSTDPQGHGTTIRLTFPAK